MARQFLIIELLKYWCLGCLESVVYNVIFFSLAYTLIK